jgi:hypothetical protein
MMGGKTDEHERARPAAGEDLALGRAPRMAARRSWQRCRSIGPTPGSSPRSTSGT